MIEVNVHRQTMTLEHCLQSLNTEIVQRLTVFRGRIWTLQTLHLNRDALDLVRNPFRSLAEKFPYEFVEHKAGIHVQMNLFDEKHLTEFWPLVINSYPKVTEKPCDVCFIDVRYNTD